MTWIYVPTAPCPQCAAEPTGSRWTGDGTHCDLRVQNAAGDRLLTTVHEPGCSFGPVTQLDLADFDLVTGPRG